MKKFTIILLAAIFVLTPSFCFAEEFENGLTVDLSSDWTKSNLDNKDKNLIYHANNGELELGIYSKRDLKSNKINSWKQLSDEELMSLAETAINEQNPKKGVSIEDWSSFDNNQMRFLKFTGTITNKEDRQMQFVQYTTIQNGGTLQFTFYKDKAFDNSDIKVMDTIVSSAIFNEITEAAVDKKIILTFAGIIIAIVLLIASAVWNVRRYRKKLGKHN